jgi:hypothetical protein
VELVRKLNYLPLVLAMDGAFFDQVVTTFADYLCLYKESWLKLQRTSPGLESYEDRALYSIWNLLLDQIKRQNELSTKLVQL